MDRKILQKKIIMEKPKGIQRNFQKFVFWCGNIGNSKKKIKSVKIAPYIKSKDKVKNEY